jgi:hypothetical protein
VTNESVNATLTISAGIAMVFDVIADPVSHAAIDGTGWVCDPVDHQPLVASGQIFRMGMYHPNHPNGHYEMANRVLVFEKPTAISWKPGYDPGDGELRFGGWVWRYDLAASSESVTEVTLAYDWSEVSEEVRQTGPTFPPFPPDHLNNSLSHLAELVASRVDSPGITD